MTDSTMDDALQEENAPASEGSRRASGTSRHTVTARTKARRRAVEILYEADQRGLLGTSDDHDDARAVSPFEDDHDGPGERFGGGIRGFEDLEGFVGADIEETFDDDVADSGDRAQALREFAAERFVHSANHTEAPPYSREILAGVADHLEQIDETVRTYAQGWVLSRMPAVDRAIARVATWEIVWNDDVDAPVAVDEAMTLGRMLSTDESPRYLNGLLGRIGDLADTLR